MPRNLLIASMLHRANYIEQAGTGIKRIKLALAKHKKKIQLKIEHDDEMFYSLIFKKSISRKTTQKTTQKTTEILNLIKKNPHITRQQLSKKIQNITSDGIKYHLEKLKKQGTLKRVGSDKAGYWKIIKK